MATVSEPNVAAPSPPFPTEWSLADLWEQLGCVPLERIRLQPSPGKATPDDVDRINAHEDRLFELIDGVLVEKTVGWYESFLAARIATKLHNFLETHPLGIVLGPDGTLEVLPDMVRIPDVCFISWERFPDGKLPTETPIPPIVPNLAVEVLSKSNTQGEMERKLNDYFDAGVQLVWYIDPRTRTATVYTAADEASEIGADGVLSGSEVLPGFELSLEELFEQPARPETD